ncbi:MAG: SPOR domain-containing protein [Spirochaetes bacterium]|nr:SPOR domain-containing protein [Spirochaetota bacterium]
MSEDMRKVPIIILSVSFVLIVFIGIALLFNWPGQQAARLPATSTVNPGSVSIGEAWVHPALSAGSTAGTVSDTANPPAAAASTTGAAGTETTAAATASGAAETTQATQSTGGGNLYIIYGDNPDPATIAGSTAAPTAGGSAASAAATTSGSSSTTSKPYTPAPATPARTTAPAATSTTTSTSSRPASTATTSTSTTRSSSSSAAVPRTEYWIQAASLTNRSRAEDLQASLISSGLSAIINIHEVDGTPWYRVRIGPYQSRNEADGWLGNIKKLPGCAEAYISEVTVRS